MNDPLQDQQQMNHLRNYKCNWSDTLWDVILSAAVIAGVYAICYLLSDGAN